MGKDFDGKEICYVNAISQKRYNYTPCIRAVDGCDDSSDVAEEISDCLLDYRKAHVSVDRPDSRRIQMSQMRE